MAPSPSRHALVFGASGLAGWAILDHLLRSEISPFEKLTGVVNKPLDPVGAKLPVPGLDRRLVFRLVSGIDLTQGTSADIAALLKARIGDIETVTHVFYFAYKQDDDPVVETEENRRMVEGAIGALDLLAPRLQFVVVPTGTKAYGVHLQTRRVEPPFEESMGRIGGDEGRKLFYFALHDVLTELSQGKKWTWCDVRPDAVIGFAPRGSVYNLLGHWATYLSLYAEIQGKGAQIPFPGNMAAYTARFTPASAWTIARFSIWASLNPRKTGGGQVFNIADSSTPVTMSEMWPRFAALFGLHGTDPTEDLNVLTPTEYIQKHGNALELADEKPGPVYKSEAVDLFYGHVLTFDRHMSIDKVRAAGFEQDSDPFQAWALTVSRMRKWGMMIP